MLKRPFQIKAEKLTGLRIDNRPQNFELEEPNKKNIYNLMFTLDNNLNNRNIYFYRSVTLYTIISKYK